MLLNDTVLNVMWPFLRDMDTPHHGSEIARIRGLNQKTVSNILNCLEDEGLLRSKIIGKNKEFKVSFDDREKTMRFLFSLENARALHFLDENPKIKEIVTKTKPYFRGIVIIFGSYAKRTQKKDSDLDVLSIGEYDAKRVEDVSILYGIRISVKNMMQKDFRKALREKDVFIKEVVADHIILRGVEDYLELVMREYYGR